VETCTTPSQGRVLKKKGENFLYHLSGIVNGGLVTTRSQEKKKIEGGDQVKEQGHGLRRGDKRSRRAAGV